MQERSSLELNFDKDAQGLPGELSKRFVMECAQKSSMRRRVGAEGTYLRAQIQIANWHKL